MGRSGQCPRRGVDSAPGCWATDHLGLRASDLVIAILVSWLFVERTGCTLALIFLNIGFGVRILISASLSSVLHLYYFYFPAISHPCCAPAFLVFPSSPVTRPPCCVRLFTTPVRAFPLSPFSYICRTRYNSTRSCTYICHPHRCFPSIPPSMSSSSTVYGCRYLQCISSSPSPLFLGGPVVCSWCIAQASSAE